MTLPAAVPPYTPDVAALHRLLGEMSAYQLQLMDTLRERATEANSLHDRVLELEETVIRQREELERASLRHAETRRGLMLAPLEDLEVD